MGTKKQTVRNRFLAFAVVMVYVMALLPSFAFAAVTEGVAITSFTSKYGDYDATNAVTATGKSTFDITIPYTKDGDDTLVVNLTEETDWALGAPTVTTSGTTIAVSKSGSAPAEILTITNLDKLVAGNEIAGTGETRKATVSVPMTKTGGDTATYTFNITRRNASSDNTLSALTAIAGGTDYIKNFKKDTKEYNVEIPADKATGNLVITPTPNDTNAVVEVTPNTITLSPGMVLPVTVKVKAENGSLTSYRINIKVTQAEADNSLKELSVVDGDAKPYAISPVFNPTTRSYVFTVPFSVNEIWVKGVARSDKALPVTYNPAGTPDSGSSSPTNGYTKITVNEGYNPIVVTGNAQDGSSTNYNIGVTRLAKATTASVKDIQITGSILDQKFNAGSLGYTGKSFAAEDGEVIVNTTEAANRVKIVVNGKTLYDGTTATKSGDPHAIKFVDATKVEVTVMPEDTNATSAVTYTFNLTKDATMTSPAWSKALNITETTATIQYDQPKGMEMFAVYYRDTAIANSKWICGGTAKAGASQIVVKNLAPSSTYEMKVTAGRKINNKLTYIPLSAASLLRSGNVETLGWNAPTLNMIASNSTSATLAYQAVADTAAYAVYYKEANASKWTYGGRSMGKATPITITGLNAEKTYDFVLTPGKMINGKMVYLPLDNLATKKLNGMTLNKTGIPVVAPNLVTTNSSVVVAYSGVSGADSYALYQYNTEKKAYEYVTKTANPNELIATGLKGQTAYEFKLTVGKLVNGKMTYVPLDEIQSFSATTK